MLPGVWPGVVTICRSKTRSPSSTGVERSRDADARDVLGARVGGHLGCRLHDFGCASGVVVVAMRDDQVFHGGPVEADLGERILNGAGTSTHARVNDRSLTAPSEDVRRHEAEIHPLPGHAVARRGIARGRRARGGRRRRLRATRRRASGCRSGRRRRGSGRGQSCGRTSRKADDGEGKGPAAQVGDERAAIDRLHGSSLAYVRRPCLGCRGPTGDPSGGCPVRWHQWRSICRRRPELTANRNPCGPNERIRRSMERWAFQGLARRLRA